MEKGNDGSLGDVSFFSISRKGDVFALLEEVTGSGEARGVSDNFVHWGFFLKVS